MKRICKRFFSIVLSVLIILGIFNCGFVSATQKNIDSCEYLKNYLLENGDNISGRYCLVRKGFGTKTVSTYTIAYDPSADQLVFEGSYEDDLDFLYMYIDDDETDGYVIDVSRPSENITGGLTYIPSNYSGLDYINKIKFNAKRGPYPLYGSSFDEDFNSHFAFSMSAWNDLLEYYANMTMGNFGFINYADPVPVLTTTIKFDANGGKDAPTAQKKERDVPITLTLGVPVKYGYKFLGWSTDKNATEPTYYPGGEFNLDGTITLFAVWQRDEIVASYNTTVKIVNNPGTKNINYLDELKLQAETTNMPEGAYVMWYQDGHPSGFTQEKIDFTGRGSAFVTVKVHDKNGDVICDENGNEVSDSETIVVNTNFFLKILFTIKRFLFGSTIVYN